MSSPTYTFTGGSAPSDFTPNSITELGSMLGKISEQVIREVIAEDRLNIFSKKFSETGDTIEQVIVKLANARAYDSTGAGALTRKTPSIVAKYFNDWTRAVYDTTVDIPEIRKVLMTGKGASELSQKIVSVLSEGEKDETYNQTKNLLKWGRQDQSGKVLVKAGTIAYGTNAIDFKGVLKSLKNIVSGMQYVNDDFNTASIKRKTLASDIYILIPYKLKNELDVEELAGVFNLDKVELKSRIIEIDTDVEEIGGKDSYTIYIVDKNAVLKYTRLFMMEDQKNADGLFWNYFLHTEKMYGLSPLFDGCYILVQTE